MHDKHQSIRFLHFFLILETPFLRRTNFQGLDSQHSWIQSRTFFEWTWLKIWKSFWVVYFPLKGRSSALLSIKYKSKWVWCAISAMNRDRYVFGQKLVIEFQIWVFLNPLAKIRFWRSQSRRIDSVLKGGSWPDGNDTLVTQHPKYINSYRYINVLDNYN